MHFSIHERLLFRKLKDKEHEKLEMFFALFMLNTIRYCTLFTVIETITCTLKPQNLNRELARENCERFLQIFF